MDDDEEADLDDPRNTAGEKVWNIAIDLEESEDEQEVSFTKQVGNELYDPVANDRGGTSGSADLKNEKKPSDKGINDHDIRTRETSTAHTVGK